MTERAYNRDAAVEYARRWALSRNPAYASFNKLGGDCTNFASQCLYAGSRVMNYTPDIGWYYQSLARRSAPWSGVPYLFQFMTTNHGPGPYGRSLPLFNVQPGDIIQLNLEGQRFCHSIFVVGLDGTPSPDTIRICAHSED